MTGLTCLKALLSDDLVLVMGAGDYAAVLLAATALPMGLGRLL